MIHIYSPEETLALCKPCFGGWDLNYKNQSISGVYLADNQASITKEMVIKILDKINKFFPLYWCDVDILCLPFRPMGKDKKGNWLGEDYNGQAWKGLIVLGAQLKKDIELSASTMILHELWHELAYRYVDSTPFDGRDTPEYKKFKELMGIQNYKDSNFLWEDRPAEILAELGRYYASNSDFTWEEFITFNDKYDPEPKREAYDYLMSLMPEKPDNTGDYIENITTPLEELDMTKEINDIIIALGDGHGINTAGKRTPTLDNGLIMKENEFNRVVIKYLNELLIKRGFKTVLVAPTDEDTLLSQRVKIANDAKADIYISVHANASKDGWDSANGIETYCYKFGGEGEKLAKSVHAQLIKGSPQRDRGVKEGNFYVLKETKMPAILTENAFMNNKDEVKLLLSDEYRKECAKETYQGICDYYKIEYKEEKKEENKVSNSYKGYKIIDELPIILDGKEIELKALKIETPEGGVTLLKIRDFLQDIIRDKFGIDLEVGYDGRVLLNSKKKQ